MSEKLEQYRSQLAQVEAAIEADPTNPEWKKLRSDLLEVIQLTSELGDSSGAGPSEAAPAPQSYSVNDRCQALFEEDGNYYNAKVVALSEDGYFVTFLGYGNTAQVEFTEVRPYVRPDTAGWRPGMDCTALHVADNRWYDAKLSGVSGNAAKVIFKGSTEVAELELDLVRLKPPAAGSGEAERKRKAEAEAAAAKAESVPKSLEILPDDSEDVIARKKKKLNMFKRQGRKDREEKQGEVSRGSWQSFQKKNKTIQKKADKRFHDPHWDPTRNHSELAARLAMEKSFAKGND